uniref:sorting nexin-16-like isoform X3 n=1 Tax=Myxine glutinosa TaxID=7769 RepID=UPI00358EF5A2
MATRLCPLSQSLTHDSTGEIGKQVRASSTNTISCGLTLEGDRGQHNGTEGKKIGWPSGDTDRAAFRGSECTSEEEDECENGEDEEKEDGCRGHSRPATPTLLGHEVMEDRARFTIYKILVKPRPEESWVVFRRYTDFARLNDKLKEMFPGFRLALPPKRWFKDNFDPIFLEDRQAGLQAFLQNLVAHKDVTNCIPVRDFLCLDEPPGPFDSLVESRAFCEGLEETNYQLQRDLLDRQREIDTLRVSRDLSTNRLAVLEESWAWSRVFKFKVTVGVRAVKGSIQQWRPIKVP